MRGRLIMWSGDGQGYRTPYEHYWIVVSRHETGLDRGDKFGKPPLLVVPLNSYINEEETPIGPSDVKIVSLFGDNKVSIARCGQLRACRRTKKIKGYDGPGISDELLTEIDSRLVEVLGLEDHVNSLIKKALAEHGVNL